MPAKRQKPVSPPPRPPLVLAGEKKVRAVIAQGDAAVREFLRHPHNMSEFFATEEGNALLGDNLWRMKNLYFFPHIEGGHAINIDWEEPYMMEFYLSIFGPDIKTLWQLLCKSRQVHITTASVCMMQDYSCFRPGSISTICNFSIEESEQTVREKLHRCVDLSPFLQWHGARKLKDGLAFPKTDAEILVSQTGRGKTITGIALVTEFAKVAATYPAKAADMLNGLMAAAEYSPIIIETTPRGPSGLYYEMCEKAQKAKEAGELGPKSFNLHFIGWHQKRRNVVSECMYDISLYDGYFQRIEKEVQTKLSVPQRNWWVSTLKGAFNDDERRMREEHPGSLSEAWTVDSEAFILLDMMGKMEEEGRVCPLSYKAGKPVIAAWDIGWADPTCCVLAQAGEGDFINIIRAIKAKHQDLEWFFARLSEMGIPIDWHILPADAERKNEHVNRHLIPNHDTVEQFFRETGRHNYKGLKQLGKKGDGFRRSRAFCHQVKIHSELAELLKDLRGVRRSFNKNINQFVDELTRGSPSNHYYDCFEAHARTFANSPSLYKGGGGLPKFLLREGRRGGGDGEGGGTGLDGGDGGLVMQA